MRAEIRRYVRAHLQDPGLGPASIARAFSISVRALHALFEDVDASVAGAGPHRAPRPLPGGPAARRNGGSVTDIAFRWGFCDAAHFSRVFKREFGATPSEVRHEALAVSEYAQLQRRSSTRTALPSLRGTLPGSSTDDRDPQPGVLSFSSSSCAQLARSESAAVPSRRRRRLALERELVHRPGRSTISR